MSPGLQSYNLHRSRSDSVNDPSFWYPYQKLLRGKSVPLLFRSSQTARSPHSLLHFPIRNRNAIRCLYGSQAQHSCQNGCPSALQTPTHSPHTGLTALALPYLLHEKKLLLPVLRPGQGANDISVCFDRNKSVFPDPAGRFLNQAAFLLHNWCSAKNPPLPAGPRQTVCGRIPCQRR